MSNKTKGCNAERELIHLFWSTKEWAACRVAGSGSMHYPAPDIIASKNSRTLAIECKKCKGDYQYLEKKEVEELEQFSKITNSEPLIAVRFNNEDWRFLLPKDLKQTEKNFVITRQDALTRGKLFIDLLR